MLERYFVKPETVPSWHRLRVPIGRDGHVGTGEAATATRFTSNLGLENRLYDQKGIQAKPADRDLRFSREQTRSVAS